jgi:hypothetical protein
MTTLPKVDTKCTAPSLIPTANGNTVRSFSTHGQQSAAQGSSTTVSRSDIRLIQYFDSSALGLVRRWRLIGYFPIHLGRLSYAWNGKSRRLAFEHQKGTRDLPFQAYETALIPCPAEADSRILLSSTSFLATENAFAKGVWLQTTIPLSVSLRGPSPVLHSRVSSRLSSWARVSRYRGCAWV